MEHIRFGVATVDGEMPATAPYHHPLLQFVEYRVNSMRDIDTCPMDEKFRVVHLPEVTEPKWDDIVTAIADLPGDCLVNVHARPADEFTLCYHCSVRLVNTRTAGQSCDYCGQSLDPEQIDPNMTNAFPHIVGKLEWAAGLFGRKGKRLTIENTYESPELLKRILDRLPADVGFTLDTGHSLLYHINTTDYIYLLRDRLTHLHLHDNMGGNSERYHDNHLTPGAGIANWIAIARALRQVQFRGTATFECRPDMHWAAAWTALFLQNA